MGQWLHIYFNQLCWNKSKSAKKKKKNENNKKRQVLFLKGKRNSNNGTKLILSLKLFLISILKECLCWLVKSTDCCHYFLTEQQTHTWTLLPTAVTSNTSAREYCYFFIYFFLCFSTAWLQHVIDFVSFAIPRHHCRQYCLIRLPDYSSREWKENGRGGEQWQCRDLREMQQNGTISKIHHVAVIFFGCRGINSLRDCLQSARVFVCFCLCGSDLVSSLISGAHTTNILDHVEMIV